MLFMMMNMLMVMEANKITGTKKGGVIKTLPEIASKFSEVP